MHSFSYLEPVCCSMSCVKGWTKSCLQASRITISSFSNSSSCPEALNKRSPLSLKLLTSVWVHPARVSLYGIFRFLSLLQPHWVKISKAGNLLEIQNQELLKQSCHYIQVWDALLWAILHLMVKLIFWEYSFNQAEWWRIGAFEPRCWRSPLDCKEIQPVHPKGNLEAGGSSPG